MQITLQTTEKGVPSISLTVDSSFITAWANDVGFKSVFAQQVGALGTEGDVFIALSTSGNSGNVIEAVEKASLEHQSTTETSHG